MLCTQGSHGVFALVEWVMWAILIAFEPPKTSPTQPVGKSCAQYGVACSYTGCLCGSSVCNAKAMLWRYCGDAARMLWQCYVNMLLLPSSLPWLVFMVLVMTLVMLKPRLLLLMPCMPSCYAPPNKGAKEYLHWLNG